MTEMTTARDRLERARDLPAVIEAAYEVFVSALTTLRAWEDPASVWFGRFVMAAASAADGRDAMIFAPSMPARRACAPRETGEDLSPDAETLAADTASLCGLAAVRLAQAPGQAADPGDQAACLRAARCAQRICELLAEAGT